MLGIMVRTTFAYYMVFFKEKSPVVFHSIFLITALVAYLFCMVLIRWIFMPVVPPLSDPEMALGSFCIAFWLNDLFNRMIKA